ncbi:MAG: hypothetical protein QOG01_3509 [Pseudonocardiales bacterium]|jgi:hypothetical protein|nr:hypothetical protein [Pseudonocardiales bacterium]
MRPPSFGPTSTMALVLAAALAGAGCSSSVAGHGSVSPPTPSVSVPASSLPSTAAAPAPSAPTAQPVTMNGDAVTNPACTIISVAELEALANGQITGLLGLSTYSHYAPKKYHCTWYFAATDISSPVVEVSYERARRSPADLVGYLKSLLTQHIAKPVAGLPKTTVAEIQGHDLDLVAGRTIVSVRAWLHNDATEPVTAIAVTKLVLSRVPR